MNNQLDIAIPKSYLIYESNKARELIAVLCCYALPFSSFLYNNGRGEKCAVKSEWHEMISDLT